MRAASVANVQGFYYLVTGVWPFVHMTSFLAATGPKTDLWLVRTVAALVCAVALALLAGGRRDRPGTETAVLGAAAAAALGAVEGYFALTGLISPVYLADAALEAAFVLAWTFSRR